MPYNFKINQLDYGNAINTGQQIKYNRMRNQAMSQQQQEREDQIRKRTQAAQIRAQMEQMPAAIDEMEQQGLYEEADKLRNHYIGQMKRSIEVGRELARGLNKDNYQQVRHDMIQSGAISGDMWPTEYQEDWWANKVGKEKQKLSQHTIRWQENGATVTQDLLARDGDIFWQGTPFESAADRKAREGDGPKGVGPDFQYKASDDNAIGSQATRLFGGVYDPSTGQFSGLSPDKAQKVQAVHSAASEIYAAGRGSLTHSQAVREAARRLRITIEDPADTLATDPAGILPGGGEFTPPSR